MGAVWWAGAANTVAKKKERSAILEQLNIQPSLPTAVPGIGGEPVRIGIIGFGIRGEQLCRALGYATNEWKEEMRLAAEEIFCRALASPRGLPEKEAPAASAAYSLDREMAI